MRKITCTFLAVLAIASVAARWASAADPQNVSLVINPRTGAASIRNDTGAAINIDSYLITSAQPALNPTAWMSLQDAGVANWLEANPSNIHLAETNLQSSLALGGGESRAIGSPYVALTPTAIGQAETPVTFTYGVPGTMGSITGDVVFSPQNNVVLQIDPVSGNASLVNQSNFDVNLDALLITSTTGALDPVGWNGLAESGVAGWTAGTGAANRLAEGNLMGSTLLAANGGTRAIGKPINSAVINDETDVVLEYHIAGGGAVSVVGGVQFASLGPPPGVAGDYNGNGTVDAADYVQWRNGGPLQNEGATPNTVTVEDYNFWRARFGATSGSGSANSSAVPEPSAAILLLLGVSVAVPLVGLVPRRRMSNYGSRETVRS
jgi:hypothetical protein